MSIRKKQKQDISDVLSNVKLCIGNHPALLALYNRYIDRAESLSYGRNRCTFLFNNFVVKLPMNTNGISDNDWEGSVSNGDNQDPWHVRYARTRLIYIEDIPVVFMERVNDASYEAIACKMGEVPIWVDSVDCGQVGFNRRGKLVAYDYGIR